MSNDGIRVACPDCGQRFRVDPDSVPEGGTGNKARCGGCGADFFVRREGTRLEALKLPNPAKRAKQAKKKARKTAAPTSRKRREAEGQPQKAAYASPLTPIVESAAFGLGDRVGRYEVEAVLARGGMGGIYKVYDPAANRHVALKVLVSTCTQMDRLRFQREIQVQGNIQHPNILPIFDSGVVGTTRYFTMELLKDPIDLLALTDLRRSGEAAKDPKLKPISTIEGMVRHILVPVCDAIHHANVNEGVLHRDLKPGNVLVDRSGLRPLVIDFGVSSLLEKKNARLAHLDRDLPVPLRGEGISITGTLVFMPPEQARGEADRRGDVWALGALLQYLVSGEPPLEPAVRPVVSQEDRIEGMKMLIEQARSEKRFSEAEGFEAKLKEIASGGERSVEDLRRDVVRGRYQPLPPGVPRVLGAIIERARMPDPEQRYRHAMELQQDLLAWLEGRPVRAMVKSTGAAGGALYRGRLWVRRHSVLVASLGVLGVGAVLTVANWPPERSEDLTQVAQARMEQAQRHLSAGRYEAARAAGRAALRADPGRDAALDLLARIGLAERRAAAWTRALALRDEAAAAFEAGDLARARNRLGALQEVLESRALALSALGAAARLTPESAVRREELLAYVAGHQPLAVRDAPPGCRFTLYPVAPGRGSVGWQRPRPLEAGEAGLSPSAYVVRGAWVLQISRAQGHVFLPFEAEPGGGGVDLVCPLDPAALDGQTLYVPAGRGVGPTRSESVRALLWDRAEVTGSRYAAFLKSLPPEERRRRVPRLAGALGALGVPLWDAEGDGYRAPADALRRPIEGISLYDAQAFARFEKKRLPTASEWAWAAAGADGRLCAIGGLRDVLAGGANVDRPLAGVADGLSAPLDRSPFGLYDMTGNLAEFTSTLGSLRGMTGWFVLGGSYETPPSGALVSSARAVPGWMPLQGVGIRCVRDPE